MQPSTADVWVEHNDGRIGRLLPVGEGDSYFVEILGPNDSKATARWLKAETRGRHQGVSCPKHH